MDVSTKKNMQLLKQEFPNLDRKCLDELMKHFEHDYDCTREFLRELFYADYDDKNSKVHPKGWEKPKQKQKKSVPTPQGPLTESVFLQISPQLFDQLHLLFNHRHDSMKTNFRTIREDLGIKDSILLPINLDLSYQIYCNLMKYVQKVYGHLMDGDVVINNYDYVQHKDDIDSETKMEEIIETQAKMEKKRREHLQQLIVQRKKCLKTGKKDENLLKEWNLEKRRDFLIKNFPGVDLLKLNRIFEMNLHDLNETIKDIEAFYDCKLPYYYQKSLYSEIIKKSSPSECGQKIHNNCNNNGTDPNKTVKSGSIKSSSPSSQISLGKSGPKKEQNKNENEFEEEEEENFEKIIKNLLETRDMYYVKMEHLKEKKLNLLTSGSFNVVHIYQQEMNECYRKLRSISEDIIDTLKNHDYPDNQIDLHGLIMDEVRTIIPWVLRHKYEQMERQKLSFKIITGVGAIDNCGPIRRFVCNYMLKKKLNHRAEGPGAFTVFLYANKQVDFGH